MGTPFGKRTGGPQKPARPEDSLAGTVVLSKQQQDRAGTKPILPFGRATPSAEGQASTPPSEPVATVIGVPAEEAGPRLAQADRVRARALAELCTMGEDKLSAFHRRNLPEGSPLDQDDLVRVQRVLRWLCAALDSRDASVRDAIAVLASQCAPPRR